MRSLAVLAIVILAALILIPQSLFTVTETEYGVVTRFGEIQRVIRRPGLNIKTPFVEKVTKYDNRNLRIDVRVESMPDKEQQFLEIDAYLRYRITDPRKFLLTLRDEFTATGRIGNIAVSEIRRVVAGSDRTDIIGGVTKNLEDGTIVVNPKLTPEGEDTREALTREVLRSTNAVVQSPENDFGVEIIDVRIKSADFPKTVEQTVFNRMRTERDVQAKRLRAEGEQQNLTITADVDRQVRIIIAAAEEEANKIRGEGEAKAIDIFASALQQDPEFYSFQRSLQAYREIIDSNTTLVLPAENDLFQFLESPAGLPAK